MKQPNLLVAMADDLAWPHLSAYGCTFVSTPNCDRVAREGVLFTNCYTTAPTCTASRGSFLTGRYPWQLEEGCQLWGLLPAKYRTYADILAQAGYVIGVTNKGWGPGSVEASGRPCNPAGPGYNRLKCTPITSTMSRNDYAANFADFLDRKPEGKPFCFWYGSKEPHRPYEKGSGLRHGKCLADVDVPGYLPDCPEVRSDFLDYALEIERFDYDLGRMIELLERCGELENTVILVTGDNGFPFPRAKATVYQNGCHVPLAVRWGAHCSGGRTVTDFVSFVDVASTLLEIAGLEPEDGMAGRSFADVIVSPASGRVDAARAMAVTGRERHGYCRPDNIGNPMRSIVTDDYLYIHNFSPDREPADTDGSPTKTFIEDNRAREDVLPYYELCFGKRPEHELYAAADGPDCIRNLAAEPDFAEVLVTLRDRLHALLIEQGDPRMHGQGWIFECYPYFGRPRAIPEPFPDIRLDAYQLRHVPEGAHRPATNAAENTVRWQE